jgi:O-Antigen ligase
MDTAPEPSGRAPGAGGIVFAGLVGMALLWAAVAGDGSGFDATLPVGGAAVVLLLGAFVAIAVGRLAAPRVGRSGLVLVVAVVALVTWTGITVWWSIVPDRSWDVSNRGIAYAAFLGLGVVLAGAVGRVAARVGALLLAVVTGVVVSWALLAKAVPALDPDGDRVARLREPVGYWNALALIADVGLVLGLWLSTSGGRRPVVRVAGALLTYAATLSLLLTLSRAGAVAGVAVVALWLALTSERLASGLLLAASAGPAVLVGAWAFTRPALVEDIALRSDREADGAVFGALALVGAGVVVLLVLLGSRRTLSGDARRRLGHALAVVAGAAVLAVGVLLVVGAVEAVSQGRDCAEVVNDPGRFGSLESARLCWWGEAWDVFTGHAPEGAGAGSFEVARKPYRLDARNVLQPHSVPLQQLSDGGVVALVLLLGMIGAASAVCVCAVRRLRDEERAAVVALVAAPAAYLVHALVDYSWDFIAVTAPTMFALGALAGAGRPAGRAARRPLLGVAAVLVGLAVLVSFSAPRLADRAVRASTRALDDGDFERARDRAERAELLNPLSVDPIVALARIEERRGDLDAAEDRYVELVELQPENPATWYALGIFEFEARARMCAAYRFLNEAYTLDPSGNQWVVGGPLDVARDGVNAGACEP